jgi:tetratricopeptide (TPR) repeat protein
VNPTADELWAALEATTDLPYGLARIAAVEELVNRADAAQLPDLQFATRMNATRAYQYGGEPAKAFVSFSWCLAAHDRGEGLDNYTHNLFWHFKWMVSDLQRFPQVPLDRTYAVLEEMQRRYLLAGHGMNPVHQYRASIARHIGDVATADEQFRLWQAAPRTRMSDCIGCEPTSTVAHLSWRRRDEEAAEIGMAALTGRLDCAEQPQSLLATMLVPYLRTGRLAEAAQAHRAGYRAIQTNRTELGMLADHVLFCAQTGNHARGLQLVERHLDWLRQPPTPHADMEFSAAAAGVLGTVIEAGHADMTVRRGNDEIRVGALREELVERAQTLAAQFDERNGSSEQSRLMAASIEPEQLVDHLPLSGPIRKSQQRTTPESVPAPSYPADPDQLIELAEHQAAVFETDAAKATWTHFDQTCQDPAPAQLARRLNALANEQADTDPAQAEETWLRAAELFASAGDEARCQAMHGRIAFLWATSGRGDDAVAKARAAADRVEEIGTDTDRAKARFRLAGALGATGHVEEMGTALTEAAACAERGEDRELQAAIALQRSNLVAGLSREGLPEAIELARYAIARYESFAPSTALRTAQLQLGTFLMFTGENDAAKIAFTQAALATDPALRGEANRLRGKLSVGNGEDELAYDLITAAIPDLAGPALAYARVDLAAAALNLNRFEDAAEAAEDALPDLENSGDAEELARLRFILAKSHRALAQPDQALDLLSQVEQHCAAQQNWAGVGQMHSLSGDILDQIDRDAEAALHYAGAAAAYHDAGFAVEQLDNLRRCAASWHWSGDNARALETLAEADNAAAQLPGEHPQIIWLTALLNYDGARIHANIEQPEQALPRIESARAGFVAVEAAEQVTIADVLQGRILLNLGRAGDAENLLAAALDALPAHEERRREQVTALLDQIRTPPAAD